MHQRLQRSRDVAVVDEEVLFDVECWIASLEIAGAIVFDTMPQDQILRARGRPTRIGLREAHLLERSIECSGLWEIPCDRVAPQIVESDHCPKLPTWINRSVFICGLNYRQRHGPRRFRVW